MPLISVNNLTLSYENKKVIDKLSFDINEGDYIAVTGENGSGKSTLIKALAGLKEATSGEISYSYNKNECGYLSQETVIEKNFPATAFEVVKSGCLNKKSFLSFYNKNDKEKALSNMRKMEIEEVKNKPFSELSGGQKQRVILARALCSASKIILLDEPVAGLDPKASKKMYELIYKINKEALISVVMVSHDIEASLKSANKVLHINENGIFFGTTDEYIKSGYYKNM